MEQVWIRSPHAKASGFVPSLAIWIGLLANLLMMVGGIWDVSWHRTSGRESFWSPPHFVMYSGVIMMGLVCVVVTLRATLGQRTAASREAYAILHPPSSILALWGLRAQLGFAIAGFGVLGVLLSAPFDEWWHRMFGIDVTIWSPPHLFAIAAAAVIRVGMIVALVQEMRAVGQGRVGQSPQLSWRGTSVAEWVLLLLFSLFMGNLTFALGQYDYLAESRDPLLYPILASVAGPVALVAGVRTLGRVGAATVIVLLLMARRELISGALLATGFIPPSAAPLYLVPAIGIDVWLWISCRAPESAWRNVAAGILFAWIFVGTEYGYTAYLTGKVWPIQPLALSEPLACVAGAASAWAGYHLARWLPGHMGPAGVTVREESYT